jgi:hypothetical protein
MSAKLTIALARFGDAASFASLVVACNDRDVTGLACRQQHSRFCSAERFRNDDYHAGFFVGVSIAAFCPRHSG